MKKGYTEEFSSFDLASERSDNEAEGLLEVQDQCTPPRLTTPEIPVAQNSRNSSFSSTDDHGQFHVMRRRNAFINVDERSVNEVLGLGTGSSGRSSRQFSLQFQLN